VVVSGAAFRAAAAQDEVAARHVPAVPDEADFPDELLDWRAIPAEVRPLGRLDAREQYAAPAALAWLRARKAAAREPAAAPAVDAFSRPKKAP